MIRIQMRKILYKCVQKSCLSSSYLVEGSDVLVVIEDGIHEMDGFTTSRWHTVPVYIYELTMR